MESSLLARLNGINLSHHSYFLITVMRFIKNIGRSTYNKIVFEDVIFHFITIFRFILSLIPWFFIPFVNHQSWIHTPIDIIYILLIFQLQFTLDIIIAWLSGSKFALLLVNRQTVLCFSSQVLLAIALFSMAVMFGPLDLLSMSNVPFISSFPFFIFVFIALLCRNGIGPFAVTTKQYELLNAQTTRYSNRFLIFYKLSRMLDIMFSCALIVLLFFNTSDITSSFWLENQGIQFLIFIMKMLGIWLLFLWIHGTLLVYRADQWLDFFQMFFLPLSGILLLISVAIKLLSY